MSTLPLIMTGIEHANVLRFSSNALTQGLSVAWERSASPTDGSASRLEPAEAPSRSGSALRWERQVE